MQKASSASFEVRRAAVGLAEDGDRLDAQLAAGADDPQGDLSPVGDQNAFEHQTPRAGVSPGVHAGIPAAWPRRLTHCPLPIVHPHCRVSTLNIGWPYSTGSPFSTSTATILPETSAGI